MVQKWTDVVFLHWRVPPAEVQGLLPEGIRVDTYEGDAWVGLVPFGMQGLGLPGVGALPLVNRFPEVNVRTYVRHDDRRGVWFFSLDVDSLLPTLVARAAYSLPYCSGEATHLRTGDVVTSSVRRSWPRDGKVAGPRADIAVRTGEPMDVSDPLARFLTGRWGLLSTSRRGVVRWAPVEHPTWPLYSADLLHLEESLLAAAGIERPADAPHAMWSPGVPVRVGRPLRA
jgi:uncharacterized protein YqjF (DUF2071 family)